MCVSVNLPFIAELPYKEQHNPIQPVCGFLAGRVHSSHIYIYICVCVCVCVCMHSFLPGKSRSVGTNYPICHNSVVRKNVLKWTVEMCACVCVTKEHAMMNVMFIEM